MTDYVFSALADPVRREMIVRLCKSGPLSTGELTNVIGLTRQGASRHLAMLESSGLIRSVRRGRVVMRELDPEKIRGTVEWMEKLSRQWDERLERLKKSYEGS